MGALPVPIVCLFCLVDAVAATMSDVSLIQLGPGELALTHRPKLKDLPSLRMAGVTHLVTMLAENEGAKQVGDAAQRADLAWIWVPLVGASVPDQARDAELRQVCRELCELIAAGGSSSCTVPRASIGPECSVTRCCDSSDSIRRSHEPSSPSCVK
jgi:hypothetical protein